jgi:uncharacterized protein YggE
MKHFHGFRILALALVLCAALPFTALAAEAPAPELVVRGTSIQRIDADYGMLTLGYYAEDKDLLRAQADAAATVERIIQSAKDLGVEGKDIATTNFNIGPVYDYNKSPNQVVGYRVENMLTITVRDIEKVPAVMNAALQAGANQSYGLSFASSKAGEAYREALRLAIQAAQEKAQVMADAANVRLLALTFLQENQDSYAPMPRYANSIAEDVKMAGGLGDTIMSGSLEVTATVEMRYAIGE